ncbi:hypothetical protein A2903_01890 [Candidatus Nomurabacteria bacterium RIFCSPLOWO2_01_FULL_33_17]|uniref:Membrane insertase YidC/Oxa/ALB C-terminal domain-containing protein n=1 Tax=Candidatus Nomurabacteria bacterium RIFCSPLOWO2_01_FULL_33_17 TaxID=1801764 RepID=A0A1F6WR28_9BACT|nr:MAG: hypothetical protein A2903_01890 [Candidatus Nomurabacteria bacterium RIFCSPLOWO2_01_FULL_33_17]
MWNTFIYDPILNVLVIILSYITMGDLGFAVIVLTILVKTILYPLSKKAIKSQLDMASIQSDIALIKAQKLSKEEEAKVTFALYKEKKVNPFSGCLVILIQLPIIFGLYYVFLRGLNLDPTHLYSFVHAPDTINTLFLGVLDLTKTHSIPIAILTGLTQFIQVFVSPTQKMQAKSSVGQKGLSADIQKSMQTQMKYVFPIIIGFVTYKIQAAVGLYWIVNNIITIFQERAIAKSLKSKEILEIKAEVLK